MKASLISLFLLLATQVLAQRQNVSGQINGPEGRIPNVSIREVDASHRVYNHTKADQNGYRTFTHKMLGQKSFKVTMEPRRVSPYIGNERLVLKSDRLFCGHYMMTEVKQMAWIEQMNDTLYTLILPIKMDLAIDEYPAGRTLLVLGDWDAQVMRWENVVDAYPTELAPHEVVDFHLAQSYSGSIYIPGGSKEEKTLYAYPHFQFTKANLEYLVAHPDALRRLAVDTYKADNYWNFYPTDQTAALLKQVLEGTGR